MRGLTGAALVAAAFIVADVSADIRVEKQKVATISAEDLQRGIVSQLAWDRGILVIQGAIADDKGQISAKYFRIAEKGVGIKLLDEPTNEMIEYWERKARRMSPTGLGTIVSATDSQIPMNSVQSREQALDNASNMGGMQVSYLLRLGSLVIFRRGGVPPYDGESYSWSPVELNRIAYTDGNGDLWIAQADGRNPTRLVKGNFTLPAWSDDGKAIAVAERKDNGRTWEVSIVYLPSGFK
jgi:hypothetical protein